MVFQDCPEFSLEDKLFVVHRVEKFAYIVFCYSFPNCYEAEFGIIPHCADDGVPMEHLISCLPGIEIAVTKKGTKIIHFQENKDPPGAGNCFLYYVKQRDYNSCTLER
jgi:hypothetical protein